MRISILFFSSIFFLSNSIAQVSKDSTTALEEINIKAYEANTIKQKIPASISLISKTALQRASTYSLVPAFNNVAGVRMEERSPGSYRLSMRGSLLRSPFGVRNVKVYLNDFLLTDAGGNTYLNLLDVAGLDHVEIIKGPSGSIYGAGTGGAILFSGTDFFSDGNEKKLKVMLSAGSFGTFNENVSYQYNTKKFKSNLVQSHYQSNGYRVQSSMRKDNLQYQFEFNQGTRASINGIVLFSDLHYNTPGGLTAAQFAANPKQARPATASLPSAVDQRAGIYNRTGLLGVSLRYKLSEKWTSTSSVTSAMTGFKNPFITNYEKRNESNIGLRTKFAYQTSGLHPVQWISGAEIQFGHYRIDSSGNNKGISDGKSVVDRVNAKQLFGFSQLNYSPVDFLRFQVGVSINSFGYDLQRIKGLLLNGAGTSKFNPQLLPRIACMIEPFSALGFYVQVAKGYSSPTIAEIRPSAGGIYTGLQAEYGWNKEIGLKLKAFGNRLGWSFDYFEFNLKDAIVRQTNAAGAEYFINAGSTNQRGVESELNWVVLNSNSNKIFQKLVISQATTFNDFTFNQYQIGSNNYSGKKLTGVPKEVFVFSVDATFAKNFYSNISFNYTGSLPLNDANTFNASSYRLWQMKFGWKKKLKKTDLDYFVLIDNMLNEKYSLGNDLNAFGSRFFNAAPKRNILIGLSIGL